MVAGLQSTSRCLDGSDVPPVSSPGTRRCGRTGSVVPTALSTAAAAMAAGFVVPSWSRWINPVNLSVRQSLFLLASFVPHTHTLSSFSRIYLQWRAQCAAKTGLLLSRCAVDRSLGIFVVFAEKKDPFPPSVHPCIVLYREVIV